MEQKAAEKAGQAGGIVAFFRVPEWGLVAGIGAVLALIYVLEPSHAFFGPYSQKTLLHNIALYGVLSIGAAVVIIAGGIDLSVGAVVALASVVSAKLVTEWLPGASPTAPSIVVVVSAFALTLLLGLVVGLLHALMINQFRLPPFIATLATMAGLRSVAVILSKNQSINVSFDAYRLLGRDPWYTVPVFAAVAAAASVMMGATVLGRHFYALGGNETAARLSGLSTRRLKAIAYALSAMLSALGGILFTGKDGQARGTMGVSYELYAITAAVVGGCSLAGGVGSIRGTVLGLALIQIIIKGTGLVIRPDILESVRTFLAKLPVLSGLAVILPTNIDSTQVEGLVLGTVIVLAVAFNQRIRSRG
ncbi:MAG: ABC transporter permease [Isosphaeraceae bacterium]|nr:ABC transporter permease [Isosphaeraceae bacterium]